MPTVEFTVEVPGATVEDVFEFVSNWPLYLHQRDPSTQCITQVTGGAIGVGTKFEMTMTQKTLAIMATVGLKMDRLCA